MSAAAVLAALIRVHARDGRATVRDIADEPGIPGFRTVHRDLGQLRDAGLVAWEPGAKGTLRPLVARIPEPEPTPRLEDGTVDIRAFCRQQDLAYNEGLR